MICIFKEISTCYLVNVLKNNNYDFCVLNIKTKFSDIKKKERKCFNDYFDLKYENVNVKIKIIFLILF